MDKILESFPLGFLIRSAFSGIFFVVTLAYEAPHVLTITSANAFSVALPVAVIAGVTIYGLHRSLIYPLIEWAMNSKWASCLRACGLRLISVESIKNLEKIWDMKSEKDDPQLFQRSKQIATWGDYTHLQYVSGWGILFALYLGRILQGHHHLHHRQGSYEHWLRWSAFIFLLAAVISNWRLFSVLQLMSPPQYKKKAKKEYNITRKGQS